MPRTATTRKRVLLATACIALGVVAVVLIDTAHLPWAIVPAAIGAVLAIRLQRVARATAKRDPT